MATAATTAPPRPDRDAPAWLSDPSLSFPAILGRVDPAPAPAAASGPRKPAATPARPTPLLTREAAR